MSSWNQANSSRGGRGGAGRASHDHQGGGTQPAGQAASASTAAAAAPSAPRVAIPSFREVRGTHTCSLDPGFTRILPGDQSQTSGYRDIVTGQTAFQLEVCEEVHQPQRTPAAPNFFQPKSTTSTPRPAHTAAVALPSFNPSSDEGPNKRQRTDDSSSQQAGHAFSASGLQLPPFRGRGGIRPPQMSTSSSGPAQLNSTATTTAHPVAPLRPTLGLPQYREGASRGAPQIPGINRGNATSSMGTSSSWNSSTGRGVVPTGVTSGFPTIGAAVGQGSMSSGLQQPVGPGNWAGTARAVGGPTTAPPPLSAATGNNQVPPPNAILVSKRQQGNPILKHIRNVRWVISDIIPDYQLGQHTCALFLSLRYHLLHPDYILHRMKELQKAFRLSVVVCHVDVEDVIKPLAQITKLTISNDCTLICAWSPEECARYLETLKSYQSKPATAIQERVEHDYISRLTSALTGVRGINKTDAVTLGTSFGSLADIIRGKAEAFSACPGIGPTKVHRLVEAFHEPFKKVLQASANPKPSTPIRQRSGQPAAAAANEDGAPAQAAKAGEDPEGGNGDASVWRKTMTAGFQGAAMPQNIGDEAAKHVAAAGSDAVQRTSGSWVDAEERDDRKAQPVGGVHEGGSADAGGVNETLAFAGLQDEDYDWLFGEDGNETDTDSGGDVGNRESQEEDDDDDFVQQPPTKETGKGAAEGVVNRLQGSKSKGRKVTKARPKFLPREGTRQLSQLSQPMLAARGDDESDEEFGAEEF